MKQIFSFVIQIFLYKNLQGSNNGTVTVPVYVLKNHTEGTQYLTEKNKGRVVKSEPSRAATWTGRLQFLYFYQLSITNHTGIVFCYKIQKLEIGLNTQYSQLEQTAHVRKIYSILNQTRHKTVCKSFGFGQSRSFS